MGRRTVKMEVMKKTVLFAVKNIFSVLMDNAYGKRGFVMEIQTVHLEMMKCFVITTR
uniref:Uncharacterized protein n=1 Tax=Arion vulgaris TaxID=1028688 RepID=A0A0B6Y715_9EUPU